MNILRISSFLLPIFIKKEKIYLSKNFYISNKMVYSFDYEVFGIVQGVFFRKYTKKEADKLNIKGFVQNTEKGTVIGRAESDRKESLDEFKNFLQNIGSPNSKIEKCIIKNEEILKNYTTNDFIIKK